jgi:uncharacterized membrane protein/thiol-disulfide isomerase/thioredoxin
MQKEFLLVLLFIFLFPSLGASATQEPSQPVVHGVLFYSPSCGHCKYVITETLMPLLDRYGEQVVIVGIDVSTPAGSGLFKIVMQYFKLESGPVPFLVYGDTYLIGSVDIPEKFPGLVEHYLAQGGLDWPAIPGLVEVLLQAQNSQTPVPQSPTPAPSSQVSSQTEPASGSVNPSSTIIPSTTAGQILTKDINQSVWERLAVDPLGNGLAVVVLAGMIIIVISALIFMSAPSNAIGNDSWNRLIPLLCLIGLAVAGYLSYVEITHVPAVCGPVGDCHTVQQSEYARLFGILPVGVLGIVGYVMIMLAWVIGRKNHPRHAAYASLLLLSLSTFGVLFSIYLTFLEPFIIGATCAWCLTSAIIMTVIFGLSLIPGKLAFITLFYGEDYAFKRSNSRRTF